MALLHVEYIVSVPVILETESTHSEPSALFTTFLATFLNLKFKVSLKICNIILRTRVDGVLKKDG